MPNVHPDNLRNEVVACDTGNEAWKQNWTPADRSTYQKPKPFRPERIRKLMKRAVLEFWLRWGVLALIVVLVVYGLVLVFHGSKIAP